MNVLDIMLNEFSIKNKYLINFEQISCSALMFLLLTWDIFCLPPISTSNYLRMYQIKFVIKHWKNGSNMICLTLSWRRPPSYRNQSNELQSKSIDYFLYDRDLRHVRVKQTVSLKNFNPLEPNIVTHKAAGLF